MNRIRWLRYLILGLLVLLAVPAHAQTTPMTLDQYEQLLRTAYAAASRSDRIGLDEAATQLLAAREVTLPDGTAAPADNAWLQQALAVEPPAYDLIEARLGATIDLLAQTRTPPTGDAQQKLDDVFNKPPFKDREAPSAWTQFWRNVGQAIERFFDRLFRSAPNLPQPNVPQPNVSAPTPFGNISPFGWFLLIISALLVLGIVVYGVRSVRASVVSDAKARAEAAEADEQISAGEALERAHAEAHTGDYRTAVRYLYLSSLLWLNERNLLRYDRALTNREYLQRARGNAELEQRLAPVVATFDRVWYGAKDLGEDDFVAYEQQINHLRELETRR